jgi:hypothetical protein
MTTQFLWRLRDSGGVHVVPVQQNMDAISDGWGKEVPVSEYNKVDTRVYVFHGTIES